MSGFPKLVPRDPQGSLENSRGSLGGPWKVWGSPGYCDFQATIFKNWKSKLQLNIQNCGKKVKILLIASTISHLVEMHFISVSLLPGNKSLGISS